MALIRLSGKIWQRLSTALLIAVIGGGIIAVLYDFTFLSPLFNQFENALRDIRSQYRAISLKRSFPYTVILDVDTRSIYKLGKFSGWPREYFAQVLGYLGQSQAEAVIFDIIFDRSPDQPGDSAFANVTLRAGNVYYALSFSDPDSENFLYAMKSEPGEFQAEKFFYSSPSKTEKFSWSKQRLDNDFFDLINNSAGVGFANSAPDRDGVVRTAELWLDFNGHLYPSLALSVLLKVLNVNHEDINIDAKGDLALSCADGTQFKIPLDKKGNFLIDFLGPYQTIRYISFYDVLQRRVPGDFFAGKIVFIGTSAPGMADLKSVPVQRNFPGVEIHANILADLLNGYYIYDINPYIALVILGLMCLFASLAALYLKTYQSVLTLIAISTGYVVFSLQYFTLKGVFTEVVRPEAGLFFSYLGAMIYKYVAEEKDKRFIKNAFSFFVDREIIKEILEDPSRLKLGGERRELTVLFCDIRDFTAMSERMRPEDLSTFLNVHLTEMTNIIFHNGGLLDKYIGDAVVALFGVPVAKEDHAVRGAQTAIDMVRAVKRIRTQFWGTPMENLRVGVGVNSGIASVGNMGSEFRFEYTAIGDEMNLGARLEGLNKYYGTTIIISASTAQKLGEDFIFRELDFVQVKGKSEPVGIYELLDPEDNFPLPLIKIYQQGLIAYCSQNWDIAEENFKTVLNELPKDKPSILMLEKIAHYRYHPPAANWRGVSVLEHK